MRFAIIKDGTVTNVIEADKDFALNMGFIFTGDANVNIGDEYKDKKFTRTNNLGITEEIIIPEIIIPKTLSIEERVAITEEENKLLKIRLAQAEQTNAETSVIQQQLIEMLIDIEVI